LNTLTKSLAALFLVAALLLAAGPGFRSKRQYDDHYAKHGAEFGKITKEQYLTMAQDFRDAAKSAEVLEVVREDGVVTRFHRKKGWFLAFNKDRTIRTFFVPNDGERYFLRQAKKSH
jgi:pyocin large subunit-like protein